MSNPNEFGGARDFELGRYDNLDVWRDRENQAIWYSMNAEPRPCYTWELVRDIARFQDLVRTQFTPGKLRYLVFASSHPTVFSLGGDLSFFRAAIETQDRAMLTAYARDCVTIMMNHYQSLGLPITSLAVVQGDALGAGLESALAADIVIAERGIKMGFPERLFDLVPGHGAFNLISRRAGARVAREMILGAKLHSSEDMHALGLIDILVETGKGREAAVEHMKIQNRAWNAHLALQRIQGSAQRMTYDELACSAEIWVDTAMQVSPAHLRVMDRIIRNQTRAKAVGGSEKSRA